LKTKGSFSFCDAHFGDMTSAALHQELSLADAVDAVNRARFLAEGFPCATEEL
jgi:hypothetical protein